MKFEIDKVITNEDIDNMLNAFYAISKITNTSVFKEIMRKSLEKSETVEKALEYIRNATESTGANASKSLVTRSENVTKEESEKIKELMDLINKGEDVQDELKELNLMTIEQLIKRLEKVVKLNNGIKIVIDIIHSINEEPLEHSKASTFLVNKLMTISEASN
jgi:hypothetical protein